MSMRKPLAGLVGGLAVGVALVVLLGGVAIVSALSSERSRRIAAVIEVDYSALPRGGFEMSVGFGAGLVVLLAAAGAVGAVVGATRPVLPRLVGRRARP